jgi:predicted helicase
VSWKPKKFLRSCFSGEDFLRRITLLSEREKGRVFERATQLILQTAPEYQTILSDVWLWKDVPAEVRKHLALPDLDEGIDLITRTRRGEYWAVQSKYRTGDDLTWRKLSTFTGLAFTVCRNISLAVVAHIGEAELSLR